MTRRHVVTALVCAAIGTTPDIARAQKEVVQQAIAEFTTATAGTFGDEDTLIRPAMDRMSAGLVEWDRAIQTFEARVVSESPSAPPRVAARLDAAVREFDAASARRREAKQSRWHRHTASSLAKSEPVRATLVRTICDSTSGSARSLVPNGSTCGGQAGAPKSFETSPQI